MSESMVNRILIFVLVFAITACSTTRVLQDGQYRLAENSIEISEHKKEVKPSQLSPYIKQKAQTWNPLICVYNWSGKNENTAWSRFMREKGVAPLVYNPDMVNVSIENMKRHLEYLGYYNSDIRTEIKTKNKKVKVKYIVTPGYRYKIARLDFILPERGELKNDFLADTASVSIKVGDFLSEESLEKESLRSSSKLREEGYYTLTKNHYSFFADTLQSPGVALLEMRINEFTRNETEKEAREFKKFNFGDVNVSYPKSLKIREKLINNLTVVYPGDRYSESAVNRTYSRLSSVNVFGNVNVELNQSGEDTVDCNINLNPSRLQGFRLNMEASSNSSGLLGLSPELSYFHKNIFRGGEVLNLSLMGNFQFKTSEDVKSTEFGISTGLSLPRFVFIPYRFFKGSIPRTDIKLSYNYQDRPEYIRNIISTSFGYTGNHKKLYYQVYPLQLNVVHLTSTNSNFFEMIYENPFMKTAYQDHFDLGLGGSLYYTTNPKTNPRNSYHYFSFQFNLAGNLLSAFKPLMKKDEFGSGMIWGTPYSQYVRGEVSAGKTWRFGEENNYSIATRVLAGAGYAYGNSFVLPFEQHFYSGGANSLRGWQARAVGPGLAKRDESFVIPNQTGDIKLEANVEYRFPLFWKFEGATFVDVGNIWTLQENTEANGKGRLSKDTIIKGLASDFGFGLRVDLTFILVRLDLGLQMHDPSYGWVYGNDWLKGRRRAIHFGVGYPF